MNTKFERKTHIVEGLHKGELDSLKLTHSQEIEQMKENHA
jgi:hypothetical protein